MKKKTFTTTMTKVAMAALVLLLSNCGVVERHEHWVLATPTPAPPAIFQSSMELAIGDSGTLTMLSAPAANNKVEWVSDRPDVAEVDANGVVTAVGLGTAKITVNVSTKNSSQSSYCDVTVSTTLAPAVYVAGTEIRVVNDGISSTLTETTTTNASGPLAATLLKNGIEQRLDLGRGSASRAESVFVSNSGDVYVAGAIYIDTHSGLRPRPAYWKNGILKMLPGVDYSCVANSILVSGDDVYVAGSGTKNATTHTVLLWTNSSLTTLHNNTEQITAQSVFVANNGDVYVWGTPALWKNGTRQDVPGSNDHAKSVIVSSNGDVYCAAHDQSDALKLKLWKNNDSPLTLGDTDDNVNSMYLSGNDLYAAGVAIAPTGTIAPTLWKNGTKQQFPVGNWAYTDSVFVKEGTVYMTGRKWEMYGIHETWFSRLLTNGTEQDTGRLETSSIFVK